MYKVLLNSALRYSTQVMLIIRSPQKEQFNNMQAASCTLGSIYKLIQFPFKIPSYFAELSPCIPSMLSFHLIPVCQVSVFQNVPPYTPSFAPHHSITITFDLYKALIPPYSFTSILRRHVPIQVNIFSNFLSYFYSHINLRSRIPLPNKTSKNMGYYLLI